MIMHPYAFTSSLADPTTPRVYDADWPTIEDLMKASQNPEIRTYMQVPL